VSSSWGPEDLSSNGTATLELVAFPREVLCVCGVTVLCSHGVRDVRRAAREKELIMTRPTPHLSQELPPGTQDYLAYRLDGARDLYLLALVLGDRPEGSTLFGRMIREAPFTSRQ
jgi:hypothetical protein